MEQHTKNTKRRTNGSGTLFQRKDGRWSAQAYVTLPNGERKRICIIGKDYENVYVRLQDILAHEKGGTWNRV